MSNSEPTDDIIQQYEGRIALLESAVLWSMTRFVAAQHERDELAEANRQLAERCKRLTELERAHRDRARASSIQAAESSAGRLRLMGAQARFISDTRSRFENLKRQTQELRELIARLAHDAPESGDNVTRSTDAV
ncbi:hypothetical protein NMY22_g8205 [Coprinellus aureogranulatus]|nr:hypothetical protein NMY22_g8205 [Coprinellus aureogranulatus]